VTTPQTSTTRSSSRAVFAIILASYFMILLDNSIIFTALPKIQHAMRFSPAGLSWVQGAYTLVFGGLLLLGSRAADLLGRRPVFVFGLAVFSLASLLIGSTSGSAPPTTPSTTATDHRSSAAWPAQPHSP
jgi:MFS family permease